MHAALDPRRMTEQSTPEEWRRCYRRLMRFQRAQFSERSVLRDANDI